MADPTRDDDEWPEFLDDGCFTPVTDAAHIRSTNGVQGVTASVPPNERVLYRGGVWQIAVKDWEALSLAEFREAQRSFFRGILCQDYTQGLEWIREGVVEWCATIEMGTCDHLIMVRIPYRVRAFSTEDKPVSIEDDLLDVYLDSLPFTVKPKAKDVECAREACCESTER
jgi:hypothetical protein